MGLGLGLAGCLVPGPSPQQVWDWGLDEPRVAYESFVTAFQGDLLEAEYACFSTAFRERNQLSQGLYRAFRDDFLAKNRGLRWGLYRSRVDEITYLDARHALLRASVSAPVVGTKRISVSMVLEDYYEVRMPNGDVPYFMDGPPERFDMLDPRDPHLSLTDDGAHLWARIYIGGRPVQELLANLVDVRFGREWRIDDIWLESAE
jgi:hypothetical protein